MAPAASSLAWADLPNRPFDHDHDFDYDPLPKTNSDDSRRYLLVAAALGGDGSQIGRFRTEALIANR